MRLGLALSALIGLSGAFLLAASPARAADDPILCGRYIRAEATATDEARVRALLANPLSAQCTDTRGRLNAKLRGFTPALPPIASPAPLPTPITRPTPVRPTVDRDGDTFARARTCADYRTYVRDFRGGRFVAQANAVLSSPQCVERPAPTTPAVAVQPPRPQTGQTIKDCAECPDMIVLPAGSFVMGSPTSEPRRSSNESPQRTVSIRSIAVSKTEITFAQWDACVAAGGCGGYRPADQGWGRGNQPVINVSWNDVQTYVTWINSRVGGQRYRLLTEAEWEYAARAGTTTPFWWGSSISTQQANYDGNDTYNGSAKGEYRQRTTAVGSFNANPFGLYDVHGNAWEWVEDCYADTYSGLATDGSANVNGSCSSRVFRGGSWDSYPTGLRSAFRSGYSPSDRYSIIGFRLARTVFTP